MEIIITKTFEDLGTTYQVGTRHHVATSVAERYIQHKVAERYKYKSVAERLSSEEAERARLNAAQKCGRPLTDAERAAILGPLQGSSAERIFCPA